MTFDLLSLMYSHKLLQISAIIIVFICLSHAQKICLNNLII